MGAWSWISWFRKGARTGPGGGETRAEAAVERLAKDLAAEALRREHWLDAGVWAPSLYAAEARSAILSHVAVTGDE